MECIFIILILASLIGGGYLIGYFVINYDSIAGALWAFFATMLVALVLVAGLNSFADDKTVAPEHHYCPCCDELIEERHETNG